MVNNVGKVCNWSSEVSVLTMYHWLTSGVCVEHESEC